MVLSLKIISSIHKTSNICVLKIVLEIFDIFWIQQPRVCEESPEKCATFNGVEIAFLFGLSLSEMFWFPCKSVVFEYFTSSHSVYARRNFQEVIQILFSLIYIQLFCVWKLSGKITTFRDPHRRINGKFLLFRFASCV